MKPFMNLRLSGLLIIVAIASAIRPSVVEYGSLGVCLVLGLRLLRREKNSRGRDW
jgi:hypothetical protein